MLANTFVFYKCIVLKSESSLNQNSYNSPHDDVLKWSI